MENIIKDLEEKFSKAGRKRASYKARLNRLRKRFEESKIRVKDAEIGLANARVKLSRNSWRRRGQFPN